MLKGVAPGSETPHYQMLPAKGAGPEHDGQSEKGTQELSWCVRGGHTLCPENGREKDLGTY